MIFNQVVNGSVTDVAFINLLKKVTFSTANLSFSGTNNYHITLNTQKGICNGLPQGNEFISVEAYYNSRRDDGGGNIFCVGQQATRRAFSFAPSRFVGYNDDHNCANAHGGKHHIVVTYDKDRTVKFYIDSVLTDSFTLGGKLDIGLSYLNQGSWMISTNDCFEGDIYFTRVYRNVYLTQSEITTLYENREFFQYDEYQAVEYIESDGSSYIDTGISNVDGIHIKFKGIGDSGSVYGARNSAGSNRFGLTTWNNHYHIMPPGYDLIPADQNIHEISYGAFSSWVATVDGTAIQIETTADSSSYNTYLFNEDWPGGSETKNICRIYFADLYQGNTIVRKLVPCYRKRDNEPGFLDTLTNTFYKNANGGSITCGPNVL